MKAEDFEKKFEAGEDITLHLDIGKARRPRQETKRINIDFPLWVIQKVDKEATRLGVTRQSLLKVWVAEKIEGRVI